MVGVVLDWFEREVLLTRTGHAGTGSLRTRGLVAARFDHFDSRAGDPNLHSHVAVANRVQGEDGVWRSIDGKTIHHAAVAMSELYDVLIADELTRRLGVEWVEVDRGPGRNPDFVIDRLDQQLLAGFSKRSRSITEVADVQMVQFTERHGRPPTGPEATRIRQTVTLATRPAKTIQPLPLLQQRWRDEATALTGAGTVAVLEHATESPRPAALSTELTAEQIVDLAASAIAAVQSRRSSWNRLNLFAEAARATRRIRMSSPLDRVRALEDVVDDAATGWWRCTTRHSCTRRGPGPRAGPAPPYSTPSRPCSTPPAGRGRGCPSRRSRGRCPSPARRPGSGTGCPRSPPTRPPPSPTSSPRPGCCRSSTAPPTPARPPPCARSPPCGGPGTAPSPWSGSPHPPPPRPPSPPPSGSRARTPPNGCTKPTAPPGNAAPDNSPNSPDSRAGPTATPPGRPRRAAAAGAAPMGRAPRRAAHRRRGHPRRHPHPRRAHQAGQRRRREDPARRRRPPGRRRSAPAAASTCSPAPLRHARLATLHRFTQPWEADATLRLRDGHRDALTAYAQHGRLHAAPAATPPEAERDSVLDAAHQAWATAVHEGRDVLLLAHDTATVRELNCEPAPAAS